jgi:TIR domain
LPEVFISYALEDKDEARLIADRLAADGISSYLASKSLQGGDDIHKNIQGALRECEEVFVLLTQESLKSDWVTYEYAGAWFLGKHIVPILLGCTARELPEILSNKLTRDFHRLDTVIREFKARQAERKSWKPAPEAENLIQLITRNADKHGHKYRKIFTEQLTFPRRVKPLEFVTNYGYDRKMELYPETYRGRIHVDTIHAGDSIPLEFYNTLVRHNDEHNELLDQLNDIYSEEKDWGANHVALALTQALNLKGFYRVRLARALLDFGRFPGVTVPGTEHLNRLSINHPFSSYLSYMEKRKLLQEYYDRISTEMGEAVEDKILKIAIHTYDKYNWPHRPAGPGMQRPAVCLLYSPVGHHGGKKIAAGIFDQLYPEELAEFTADRRLTARISLNLERVGIPVAHNNPYQLPQGSMEVRTQVWFFFKYLRREFEKARPATATREEYLRVWQMLMDTNLRSSESEMLRNYIHTFRMAPSPREHELDSSRVAYEDIRSFFNWEKDRLLKSYRYSPERPSSLAIEIRKDYLWSFKDPEATQPVAGPDGVRMANVHLIASLLADAIVTYLNKDANSTNSSHHEID